MPAWEITPEQLHELSCVAMEARARAYAPYSKFAVGAALLTAGGAIVPGCNLENASYGLTICAERTAVGNAIAAGYREFLAIAIAAMPSVPPCGACRQVLAEFNRDLLVICQDAEKQDRRQWRLSELLPHQFELQR